MSALRHAYDTQANLPKTTNNFQDLTAVELQEIFLHVTDLQMQ